jgi:hypothetical protein
MNYFSPHSNYLALGLTVTMEGNSDGFAESWKL